MYLQASASATAVSVMMHLGTELQARRALTQQPGIEEEEGSEGPAIGIAGEGLLAIHELQQAPHEEEGAGDHAAGRQTNRTTRLVVQSPTTTSHER
jgi:hypothetical protein